MDDLDGALLIFGELNGSLEGHIWETRRPGFDRTFYD